MWGSTGFIKIEMNFGKTIFNFWQSIVNKQTNIHVLYII